jgi:phosphatidylglycerophosphate synthase
MLLLTIPSLFVLQCLYALAVTLASKIPFTRFLVFCLATAGYHALILLGSHAVKNEFNLETSGENLQRINLPLYLSFIRFTAVPTLVFLFLSIDRIDIRFCLLPFLGFIFLTDLFDGILARSMHQTTRIGCILDAAGDYLLIFSLSVVYVIIKLIPVWLAVIVVIRLVIQASGIMTVYFLLGYSYLKLSFLGKVSIFAVSTLYGIELFEYLQVPVVGDPGLVSLLEIIAAGIIGISLIEKIYLLFKSFKKKQADQ